jgi:opacity protein-like surface antigen
MKTPATSLLLAATFLAGTTAWSAERGPGWDFGLDVIYQDSTDLTFEGGSRASLDSDWGFAVNFGYRFNEHLELAFALDWQTIDYNATLQSATTPTLRINVDGDLEAITPRISVNYNFMEGPITPYVTAGAGWSFVDTNIPTSRVQIGCWWDPWWGQICTPYQSTKSIDDFVYQAGVGARWDLANGFSMRLAYEKHWFDYGRATSTPDFDQFKLGVLFRY